MVGLLFLDVDFLLVVEDFFVLLLVLLGGVVWEVEECMIFGCIWDVWCVCKLMNGVIGWDVLCCVGGGWIG